MTDQHPITPPPELVKKWASESPIQADDENWAYELYIAHQAACWSANQELEACCEWIPKATPWDAEQLRSARRPKPPSLKEQATFAAAVLQSPDETCSIAEIAQHWHTIRRALEQLDD